MISKDDFILEVFKVEKIMIHIYSDNNVFLEPYGYTKMMPNGKNTVKDLKLKRLNDYLKDIDYSIIHTSPLDVFPECYKLIDVREATHYHLLKGDKKCQKSMY